MCAIASLHDKDELLLVTYGDATAELPQSNNQSATTMKHRGLCWDRRHASWRVRIFFAGRQRHIGRFKDATIAARAYDRAAYCLYGEKAILNFTSEEAAADQADVPLFIIRAKQAAEAAAAAAAAAAEGDAAGDAAGNSSAGGTVADSNAGSSSSSCCSSQSTVVTNSSRASTSNTSTLARQAAAGPAGWVSHQAAAGRSDATPSIAVLQQQQQQQQQQRWQKQQQQWRQELQVPYGPWQATLQQQQQASAVVMSADHQQLMLLQQQQQQQQQQQRQVFVPSLQAAGFYQNQILLQPTGTTGHSLQQQAAAATPPPEAMQAYTLMDTPTGQVLVPTAAAVTSAMASPVADTSSSNWMQLPAGQMLHDAGNAAAAGSGDQSNSLVAAALCNTQGSQFSAASAASHQAAPFAAAHPQAQEHALLYQAFGRQLQLQEQQQQARVSVVMPPSSSTVVVGSSSLAPQPYPQAEGSFSAQYTAGAHGVQLLHVPPAPMSSYQEGELHVLNQQQQQLPLRQLPQLLQHQVQQVVPLQLATIAGAAGGPDRSGGVMPACGSSQQQQLTHMAADFMSSALMVNSNSFAAAAAAAEGGSAGVQVSSSGLHTTHQPVGAPQLLQGLQLQGQQQECLPAVTVGLLADIFQAGALQLREMC